MTTFATHLQYRASGARRQQPCTLRDRQRRSCDGPRCHHSHGDGLGAWRQTQTILVELDHEAVQGNARTDVLKSELQARKEGS